MLHKLLSTEISQVHAELTALLQAPDEDLNQLFHDLQKSQGKMVRAQFCILFAKIFQNAINDKIIQMAANIELIHLATLVHDDTIDHASMRRGQKSIQAKYGQELAIYAGDFLFAKYFEVLTKNFNDSNLTNIHLKTIQDILTGELVQKNNLFNLNKTISTHQKIASLKTGSLFSLACQMGAYLNQETEEMQKYCAQIGLNIGLIFQMVDDLLDFEQDEQTVGKQTGQDIRNGNYTYPFIIAYEHDPTWFNQHINNHLNEQEAHEIIAKIYQLNGVQETKNYINKLLEETMNIIDKLPKTKETKTLQKICKKLVSRSF